MHPKDADGDGNGVGPDQIRACTICPNLHVSVKIVRRFNSMSVPCFFFVFFVGGGGGWKGAGVSVLRCVDTKGA